ncbi:hypothetical protein [Ferrovibrio sp.]|uniref:hypothetical protein n=1 Tax=Ferrovibrio sp. TaxID=1917215 RepID=UPI003D151F02
MTAHKSIQETKRTAIPPKPLDTTELHGRVRVAYFSFTVPAGDAAIDDTIALTTLPLGARMIGGHLAYEAMSTGGANASVQIGTAASAAKYLGTTSIDAAGSTAFGNTVALAYGDLMTADTTILATVKTEALAATKILAGHILYVLD